MSPSLFQLCSCLGGCLCRQLLTVTSFSTGSRSSSATPTFRMEAQNTGNVTEEAMERLNVTNESYPLQLDDLPYVVLVNGIVSPILVAVTLVTNICVCMVLVRPNMRSATNTLLLAMAVSDTLTGLCPLPAYFRFYSGGDGAHREWLPYNWCAAFYSLTDHLPTIFHTASVWLTVALAAQRYVYVCRAVDARRCCTIQNSLRAVAVIYVVAVVYQLCRFAEMRYTPVHLSSLVDPTENSTVVGCIGEYWPILLPYLDAYFNTYYWFRVIAVHLVPCSALVALNAALVMAMRRAQKRHRQLVAQNRKSESRRLAESNVTTMMLVAVVGVFLVVEFPLAVVFIIVIVENTWSLTIIAPDRMATASLFVNLFILLSYPLNFFIYCGMSRQFRGTLCALLHCRAPQVSSAASSAAMSTAAPRPRGDTTRYIEMSPAINDHPDSCKPPDSGKSSALYQDETELL